MVLCQQCPTQPPSLREVTQNVYSPTTLLKLARQRLLREEALAISALKDLPNMMFPEMFEEAFIDGRTKILTAMIPVWPFPYLSVGMNINNLNLDTLKAVLEGLDILISQKVRSSRCKLRGIKWRDTQHDVCGIWSGFHEDKDLPESTTQKQPVENSPECEVKKELKVMTQLQLAEGRVDESTIYLLQWAQQRKDSFHLCCRKLEIQGLTKDTLVEIFNTIRADCIQELKLGFFFINELDLLNPYLRQMNNLLRLTLDHLRGSIGFGEENEEEKAITLISQLPAFHCLQEFNINDVSFIDGNLKEFLRCLKKPLETLCITNCQLSQSDLDYLPYCQNIFELKRLYLSLSLHNLLLAPLGFLLERVRHTLECLNLKSCEIKESQLNALLPALSQCSQLTDVNFYDNNFSLLSLKQLLHHTGKLSQLTNEVYPAPLECYDNRGVILTNRLKNFGPELLDIVRAKRQPKKVAFATMPCFRCDGHYVYDLETQCCHFKWDPLQS
ncbi:uncharacterized protein LOC298621 [Rattus norvegicus]|uniref:Oogenesin 3 like 1 n=1 Tax=Rattus norvegicus TaxID=10116 RepID=Q5D011_RAT|nr:uncharacterized protein LOC298621 [Rattus norvegicus]AAH90317.1 Similar to RIKEN cDNA 4930569K13 [Rattus norvegicus]|eukprot:NP_001020157.1 uncharacterized protein LOC298621 [Rattus norvegicus]